MTEKKEKNEGLALVDGGEAVGDDTEQYVELRRSILAKRAKADENYWDLGVDLAEAYNHDCYRAWGFDSWKEYVEQEVDIHIRKAQYLVKLQEWFETMTPAIQKWMRELGWTKARMLMHVVTQENATEWKNRIEGKTVAEIEEMLKSDKGEEGSGEGSDSSSAAETTSKLSFSLFPGQRETVEDALRKAGELAESDKQGNLLTLICTEYLATNTNNQSTEDYLNHVQKSTGLKIVAVRESDDTIVFGGDYIDAQEAELGEDEDVD